MTDNKILSFLAEHNAIKIDIIRYYSLPISTAMKFSYQKYIAHSSEVRIVSTPAEG